MTFSLPFLLCSFDIPFMSLTPRSIRLLFLFLCIVHLTSRIHYLAWSFRLLCGTHDLNVLCYLTSLTLLTLPRLPHAHTSATTPLSRTQPFLKILDTTSAASTSFPRPHFRFPLPFLFSSHSNTFTFQSIVKTLKDAYTRKYTC